MIGLLEGQNGVICVKHLDLCLAAGSASNSCLSLLFFIVGVIPSPGFPDLHPPARGPCKEIVLEIKAGKLSPWDNPDQAWQHSRGGSDDLAVP
jgi:hypothetical protein